MTDRREMSVSRRGLVWGGALSVAALVVPSSAAGQSSPAPTAPVDDVVAMTLQVQGQSRRINTDLRTTLLDALRERVGVTGAKKGCDHRQCGACTVHIDGRRVLSCLTLAIAAQDKAITTIEGLATADGLLHPMQQAFIAHDARRTLDEASAAASAFAALRARSPTATRISRLSSPIARWCGHCSRRGI